MEGTATGNPNPDAYRRVRRAGKAILQAIDGSRDSLVLRSQTGFALLGIAAAERKILAIAVVVAIWPSDQVVGKLQALIKDSIAAAISSDSRTLSWLPVAPPMSPWKSGSHENTDEYPLPPGRSLISHEGVSIPLLNLIY
jgi:hypothetical protein